MAFVTTDKEHEREFRAARLEYTQRKAFEGHMLASRMPDVIALVLGINYTGQAWSDDLADRLLATAKCEWGIHHFVCSDCNFVQD